MTSKEFKSSTKILFWLVFPLYFSRLLIMSWHFPSLYIDDFFPNIYILNKKYILFPFSKINSPYYKYNFFKLKIYFVTTFCTSSQKNISERLHEKCFFNTSKHAMTLLEPLNELSFSKKFQSSTITHSLKISSHFLKLLIMSEHFSSL